MHCSSTKMRSVYCCNSTSYEKYYLDQVGHGQYFSGAVFQRDYDLGNIFVSLGKVILPLAKSGAKATKKQALRHGVAFASDGVSWKKYRPLFNAQNKLVRLFCNKQLHLKNKRLPEYKRRKRKNITTFLLRQS